jgi:protein-S-isoprenylcysteine O-methyltransferase Ste14
LLQPPASGAYNGNSRHKRGPDRREGNDSEDHETTQKIIMSFVSLGFIGLIVVPALDHRFAWSHMPPYAALAGDVLVGLGWLAVFFVFKENTFTSATIELAPGQKVISTGPYALVRHPMYAGALVMLVGIPIALGSWWGLLVIMAMMPALIWRLLDEEKFLARNLPGYEEYPVAAVAQRFRTRIWDRRSIRDCCSSRGTHSSTAERRPASAARNCGGLRAGCAYGREGEYRPSADSRPSGLAQTRAALVEVRPGDQRVPGHRSFERAE